MGVPGTGSSEPGHLNTPARLNWGPTRESLLRPVGPPLLLLLADSQDPKPRQPPHAPHPGLSSPEPAPNTGHRASGLSGQPPNSWWEPPQRPGHSCCGSCLEIPKSRQTGGGTERAPGPGRPSSFAELPIGATASRGPGRAHRFAGVTSGEALLSLGLGWLWSLLGDSGPEGQRDPQGGGGPRTSVCCPPAPPTPRLHVAPLTGDAGLRHLQPQKPIPGGPRVPSLRPSCCWGGRVCPWGEQLHGRKPPPTRSSKFLTPLPTWPGPSLEAPLPTPASPTPNPVPTVDPPPPRPGDSMASRPQPGTGPLWTLACWAAGPSTAPAHPNPPSPPAPAPIPGLPRPYTPTVPPNLTPIPLLHPPPLVPPGPPRQSPPPPALGPDALCGSSRPRHPPHLGRPDPTTAPQPCPDPSPPDVRWPSGRVPTTVRSRPSPPGALGDPRLREAPRRHAPEPRAQLPQVDGEVPRGGLAARSRLGTPQCPTASPRRQDPRPGRPPAALSDPPGQWGLRGCGCPCLGLN
ncbi:basic proline-rich protein-like [Choloepus didactylus]|uniref:basic proline-rich protein-like n=1 Tax=Choloepus didactylus TaxID=27675 RepID=UPI00189DBDCA|nr:basic proline-rich protein-like [Choloepus didactylus]